MVNTLTEVILGRKRSSADPTTVATIGSGSIFLRWYTPDRLTANAWFTHLGYWGGKTESGAPDTQVMIADTNSSMGPDTRRARTNTLAASTSMPFPGSGGGALVEGAVANSPIGPVNTSVPCYNGTHYSLGVASENASFALSMKDADDLPGTPDNVSIYTDSETGDLPVGLDVSGYSVSVTNEGHLSIYARGWANEAPLAPTIVAPTGTINDLDPLFEATFRDRNGAYGASSTEGIDTGDYCRQYRIQCRAVASPTPLVWDQTFTATDDERSSDDLAQEYAGSTLTRGTQYEWRIQTSDWFGVWGSWSNWTTFTVANLGFVTLDSDPTGKIETRTPDFKGRWTHASSQQMARVQVRILTPALTVIQTGADYDIANVNSAASPGTLFTVPWANTGLSTLSWNTSYRYQIRGKDTGGFWSDWSASRTFSTDSAPSIPTFVFPANGAQFTAYPKIQATWSDVDDTTATGLTGTFRITRPNATTVDVTPTYNATTGRWEFQTTSTQISADGTYSVQAAAYDGTLYSGTKTSLATSLAVSPTLTFTYGTGPAITITAPTADQVIATAGLTVTWTVSNQAKYKVNVYNAETDALVYASNSGAWTVSGTSSHAIPSGHLRNGESYYVVVDVENTTPISGSSLATAFSVAFTPADPVANLQIASVRESTDPWDTGNRLSWDASTVDDMIFQEYLIKRRADGGPDIDDIIIERGLGKTDVTWTDSFPASGYTYTYTFYVVTSDNGIDEVLSDPVEVANSITIEGVSICSVANPASVRTALMWRLPGSDLGLTWSRKRPETSFTPLSGGPPRTNTSGNLWKEGSIEAIVLNDRWANWTDRIAELDALYAVPGTICVRDLHQKKIFAVIPDNGLTERPRRPVGADITVTVREETYSEAVTE